ncbi:unnamed protein product [Protopolystoma xenopodis]|uniref:Uncharacterized protein n=1 Tax=Protopolystoma xenopodis TaxID=117903 RepID=A0A448X1N9_9PLAT|nr:unnamed protein product [Protopolystoma xenopodis]
MKRFESRFHQKTSANSSLPAVDWLYWKIHADAVSEAISFDSGEHVLSFRPSYDGRKLSTCSPESKEIPSETASA